ncbi:hypothetical protein LTR01_008682 [Friedmanniomyces endolithicus]|nr:hypothetical protein LTR01_008682 [Friedmanniomyces endolithicus]
MSHSKGWIKLGGLADGGKCEAAGRQSDESAPPGTDVPQYTEKCAEVLRQVLLDHEPELDRNADLLKPGAKRRSDAIAKFRSAPRLPSFPHVLLLIALTKLDKTNGSFSFVEVPEDKSIPRSEWKEEELVAEPGEGYMWRGDCERKPGDGDGGIMLLVMYS